MKRWGRKACVYLILITLISLPFSATALLAEERFAPDGQTAQHTGSADLDRQGMGPEIAGAGLAGAGVGRTINPVVLRNVLIGLACAGLWLLSAMNEGD